MADEGDSEETTTAPLPAPADAGDAGLAGGVPRGVGAGLALVGILLGAVLAVRAVVARRTPAER